MSDTLDLGYEPRGESRKITIFIGRILHSICVNPEPNTLDFLVGEFNFSISHQFDKREFPKSYIKYEGIVDGKDINVTYTIVYAEKILKKVVVREKDISNKNISNILFEFNL